MVSLKLAWMVGHSTDKCRLGLLGDEVLALRAELDSWWNDIDFECDDVRSPDEQAFTPADSPSSANRYPYLRVRTSLQRIRDDSSPRCSHASTSNRSST
jgi:hypothetical protein